MRAAGVAERAPTGHYAYVSRSELRKDAVAREKVDYAAARHRVDWLNVRWMYWLLFWFVMFPLFILGAIGFILLLGYFHRGRARRGSR